MNIDNTSNENDKLNFLSIWYNENKLNVRDTIRVKNGSHNLGDLIKAKSRYDNIENKSGLEILFDLKEFNDIYVINKAFIFNSMELLMSSETCVVGKIYEYNFESKPYLYQNYKSGNITNVLVKLIISQIEPESNSDEMVGVIQMMNEDDVNFKSINNVNINKKELESLLKKVLLTSVKVSYPSQYMKKLENMNFEIEEYSYPDYVVVEYNGI